MKKNTKGIVGLCLGLVSIILFFLSFFPMEKLTGMGFNGKLSFYGTINVILALLSFACAVTAIVFGGLSLKHKDRKGPRKTGVVLGIIFTLLSIIAIAVTCVLSTFTTYINSEGEKGMIAQSAKSDPSIRKDMDEFIKTIKGFM